MAINRKNPNTPYQAYPPSRPLASVGGYRGVNYIPVNTELPRDPRLVDRSKLPNGSTPADYANMFSRLPRELDAALRSKGHAEVSITIDERGQVQRVNSGSRNAPRATYISAMIKRMPDGTNTIAGIWGGIAGGGNNGAPTAMVTSKMMTTAQGRQALANNPVLEGTQMQWNNSQLANHGGLSRNPHAWEFANGGQSTFIPYEQTNTFGVHKQDSLGEHHSQHDTWGCTSGTEQSFLARLNSRISVMMGNPPTGLRDWTTRLGIQNHATEAAMVFVRNKDVAASTLGKVYQLNPLMFNTGSERYADLGRQLNVSQMMAPATTAINNALTNIQAATAPSAMQRPGTTTTVFSMHLVTPPAAGNAPRTRPTPAAGKVDFHMHSV